MKKILTLIRRCVTISLGWTSELLGLSSKPKIIVLCYHSVGINNWKYNVQPAVFEQQINRLLETRQPISVDHLVGYLAGKKKLKSPSFLLTFDDGYANILNVANYLKTKNIQPCVFLLSDPDNTNRSELGTDLPIATKRDWLKMKTLGWSIGSHSATHQNFSSLDNNSATQEIIGSKKTLESTLGMKISYFALPRGNHSKVVDKIIRASKYQLCMTMDDNVITESTNPLAIPRIGIDQTHSLTELKFIDSPLIIRVRGFLKKMKVSKLYE